ncbi:MAG: hypothetical protein NWF07_15345 [Candidatus Bathyarchaeota archaeon]|nr:hypothetical protein [Candidatus Bathyarchaeota archaeon]
MSKARSIRLLLLLVELSERIDEVAYEVSTPLRETSITEILRTAPVITLTRSSVTTRNTFHVIWQRNVPKRVPLHMEQHPVTMTRITRHGIGMYDTITVPYKSIGMVISPLK